MIEGDYDTFQPSGAYDDAYNGIYMYLSSPRHTNSGSKGECSQGFEENANGRYWNWQASNGTWYKANNAPTNPNRNLHARGYKVRVSPNLRDGNWHDQVDRAIAGGADLYIITHTNGLNGCPSSANYLATMYDSDDSNAGHVKGKALANKIRRWVGGGDGVHQITGPQVTGTDQAIFGGELGELDVNRPQGTAYVELQFHDNPTTQQWLRNNMYKNSYLLGAAVDKHLGYP